MTSDNQASQRVTIDEVDYELSELSDEAREQLQNLRITDQEVARLQQQLGITQTARRAYANALQQVLPKKAH